MVKHTFFDRHAFVVHVDIPPGVTVERMRQYIEDEIKANIGRLPPEDPLFHMDRESVVVRTRRR